jgi:hypothetical protein
MNTEGAMNTTNTQGTPGPVPVPADTTDWKQLCETLQRERDDLAVKFQKLEEECRHYKRAIYALMPKEEFTITKEEAMACVGQQPSLDELLDQIERGEI